MKSRSTHRSCWAHVNTPDGLRRRRAAADARREETAATMLPACTAPDPLSHWQRIVIDLYVPTSGRCDQHAVVIDGKRVGLLSATQVGARLRDIVRKRPSVALLEDERRNVGVSARDWADAALCESTEMRAEI